MLQVGDRIPDATLPDQDGKAVRLHDLLAKGPVVIFFYPEDETPFCTVESCAFRDRHAAFREAGATVVGVSADDVGSHQRFATRHRLPFTLLADSDESLAAAFGVTRVLGIVKARVTFVVDGTGIIRHAYHSRLFPTKHVTEALEAVKALSRT